MKKSKNKEEDPPKRTYAEKKQLQKQREVEDIARIQARYETISPDDIKTFKDMPLSGRTKQGLTENGYTVPTEIQKESILIALRGHDVLGAAKTGSGKTLAFLIPVLETLYCKQWTKLDGLGALIITPTRELALQSYQTLVKVGKHHEFSAGLIVGGNEVDFEKNRINNVNIIICTPGRLLQHMDQNPLFDCSNMKVLVLDEADRCLDMGFEKEMNCIIENLPPSRHTLLFSATQTRKVSDLARLSLTDPKYVSVHEHEKYKTPAGLTQSYTVCEQHDKLTVLWSFVKSHPKQKVIVFFATCNQVRYVFDIMCRLRPFNTLLALHGKIKQEKRIETYNTFCKKQHAVLFATDLAARGLDFPHVHWVIHADCPEDVEAYIHRSGRTARYFKQGESLLILNPSELAFVEQLEENRIPINEIKVNPNQLVSPQAKVEAFLAKVPELKAEAQRAFVSYVKSVYLMRDKTVFNVNGIDAQKFARSLGLVVSPRIRFIEKREKAKTNKLQAQTEKQETRPSLTKTHEYNFYPDSGNEKSDDELFTLKRRNHDIEDDSRTDDGGTGEKLPQKRKQVVTKAKVVKRILHKKILPNKKTVFSEEGEAVFDQSRQKVTEAGKKYETANEAGIDIEEAKKMLEEEDKWDRKLFKEKIKAKRRALKLKRLEEKTGKPAAALEKKAPSDDEDDDEGSDSGSEPDLSWLPDPDKVFNENEEDDSEDDDGSTRQPKRRRIQKQVVNASSDDSEDDGLGLQEKEELALKLLSSKRM